jgi:pSer/pThr/pTyr-binding forkhead associated (FHA) protein
MIRRILIGTSVECDYQVTDKTVSRKHADILVKEDGYVVLIDHDSTNGTYVEDLTQLSGWKRVRQELVKVDANILLGALKININDILQTIRPKNKLSLKPTFKPAGKAEKFIRNEQGNIVPLN